MTPGGGNDIRPHAHERCESMPSQGVGVAVCIGVTVGAPVTGEKGP